MKTVFLRAIEADDKAAGLLQAIREPKAVRSKQRFVVDVATFASVPGSPFAYWVSERMLGLFTELPPFEADGRTARQGLATAEDFRFVRAAWAIPGAAVGKRWFPFAKGGAFSPFYTDVHLVVNWDQNGGEIKNNLNAQGGVRSNVWMLRDTAAEFFFRPGLTWPIKNRFSLKPWPLPRGCVFAHVGSTAFVEDDSAPILSALQALMSSAAFTALVRVTAGWNFEVGNIQRTPLPPIRGGDASALSALARRAWSLKRSLDTRTEISHAFTLPALLQVTGETLAARGDAWGKRVRKVAEGLATIQAEIDARCFDLYGVDEADRHAVTDGFGSATRDANGNTDGDAESDAQESVDAVTDSPSLAADVVSWAVGVAFGRFDVRLATGARVLPAEPEPFDSLPICSPAMLTGDEGLPVSAAPNDYPLRLPEGGLQVDDPGHARDLTAAVRTVFELVFGDDAGARWHEASSLLDPEDGDLRNWLGKDFFEYHLKCHSKSRRKAPIVWQLATPSSTYSVWLYAHRLTKDSLFQVQNDVVGQKLAHEERKHLGLVQAAGSRPDANQRQEITAQETLVEELRAMHDEMKRVAPLWSPDLNDGVVLTMAPLWRLVPQHKSWQKELMAAWDALCVGTYDWAHLAMHLWPERVVPKCATDRSLAIAHGLQDVFWVESADGKWTPRSTPTRPTEELVRERSSPAVKASLKALLEAPTADTGGGRGRSRRAAKVGDNGGAR